MKGLSVLLCFVISCYQLCAKSIDTKTALTVAQNFIHMLPMEQPTKEKLSLQFIYTERSWVNSDQVEATNLFTILNFSNDKGFVIVSNDDAVEPILGYSIEASFDLGRIPDGTRKWLEQYKQAIEYAVLHHVQATVEIQGKWENLLSGRSNSNRGGQVGPLLSTRWDQDPYYNQYCPGGTITGCVATAMAQVMKYWNHPKQGSGFHSYNDKNYGTLSANFGGTTYNWTSMPNSVSGPNASVATLMYHCGVSVDMNYGLAANGGSSAQTLDVAEALVKYFGYLPSLKGLYRKDYTDLAWKQLLKDELNAARPIQYAGTGTGGGHSFVCDGYDNNDFFHFNWGWSGNADGYFILDNLSPGSLGNGGGTGGFNSNQRAIVGIQPVKSNGGGTSELKIDLYSKISVTPNPIKYDQTVTVNADIVNRGTTAFTGDICAALFDEKFAFVDYIDIISENNGLQPNFHYTGGLNFTKVMKTAPGKYYISIYVKPLNGEWILVGKSTFSNFEPVTIAIDNNIQMYSKITVTPNSLTVNKPLSINADVVNYGAPFKGSISADIHELDGTWIQTIQQKDNLSMPTNTHFVGGLTFTSNGLDLDPGSYIIAVWEFEDGGDWQLVSSSVLYANPVQVVISEPALLPDAYENNNTQGAAYNLNYVFIGNNATITTPSANHHVGNDNDYYKLNLAPGYNYTITTRVHDYYNSGLTQNFTTDVLWSYNSGTGWSSAYDDLLTTGNIIAKGASTVYFAVVPYFQGNTGTYLLDIQISRKIATDLVEMPFGMALVLYPNPANEMLNVSSVELDCTVEKAEFFSVNGNLIAKKMPAKLEANAFSIIVKDLPEGIYFAKITTNKCESMHKIIINHQ